jgi:hypothetical protein
MLKRLIARYDTVAARAAVALVGLLGTAQILTLLLFFVFVMEPQMRRMSDLMAQNVSAIADTMARLPEPEQKAFLARLNGSPYLRIHEDIDRWPEDEGTPSVLETLFMNALAAKLSEKTNVEWRRGSGGRMWIALTLAGRRIWMSTRPPETLRPEWAVILASAFSLTVAIVAGLVLQRRHSRALQKPRNAFRSAPRRNRCRCRRWDRSKSVTSAKASIA